MKENEATGSIRIKRIPEGEAPFIIRRAWVGLELPCLPFLGLPEGGLDRGVLTGIESDRNNIGFSVPQDQAITILAQRNPGAASWWRQQGFPHTGEFFGFKEDEAEIISGVIRQKIFQVSEEMMGNRLR